MASHARVHRQPHSYGFMFSVTDEENDGGGKTAALHHLCQIFVDAEINLASLWPMGMYDFENRIGLHRIGLDQADGPLS